jgi:predicted O-methyltransferase YrrM
MSSPVLQRMLDTGKVEAADSTQIDLHSSVDTEEGDLLRQCVAASGAHKAVEVGLAFGVSTLFILDAMAPSGGRLIGIDPDQKNDMWRGLGLRNVERAGFAECYEFFESPSYKALPQLLQRGDRIQFAFIDGWHTFDYVLLDFFFIDKLLDVGGIIVFDDVGYKSIRKACHFILANRDYEIYAKIDGVAPAQKWARAKGAAKQVFAKLARTDWTPAPHVGALHDALARTTCLAIRKTAEDTRRWDHFAPF